MKKNLLYFIFAVCLVTAGCSDAIENELNLLDRRLSSLEAACERLNSNIKALTSVVSAIEDHDFVTEVTQEKIDGNTVYTIYFSNSGPVVIREGISADDPLVGVKMNSDGKYYWAMSTPGGQTQFIRTNDGNLVAASASSPQFRINEGMWEVSYDDGLTWTDKYNGVPYGRATGESPQAFFEAVIDSAEYIIFKMKDSTSIAVPSWSAYEKIEQTVRLANENYRSTETILRIFREKLFINGVFPIVSTAGDTTGYRMTLSDGTQMSFYDGTSTNRPEVGVLRDPDNPEDSAYYWTVKQVGDTSFTWALYNGEKVRADAVRSVPQIGAFRWDSDGIYFWGISFDGGDHWQPVKDGYGNPVRASLKENAVMDAIEVTDEYVYIRQGSQEYWIERYQDFDALFDSTSLVMGAEDTATVIVNLTTTGKTVDYSEYEVLPVTSEGFVAKAEPNEQRSVWTVSVTSPASFSTDSRMSVIVSNGRGLLKTYSIELVCKK